MHLEHEVQIIIVLSALLLSLFVSFYLLIQRFFYKPRGQLMWQQLNPHIYKRPFILHRIFQLRISEKKIEITKKALEESGLLWDPKLYLGVRNMVTVLLFLIWIVCYFIRSNFSLYILLPSFLFLLFIEKPILHMIGKYRARKIVHEIYAVCNHLLYYSGSTMHFHSKLSKCITQTKMIRPAFQTLLNEWYYNPKKAIIRFKSSLGTDIGYDFAETLLSLYLDDNPEYYDLLNERIQEYKERIDLYKVSQKEMTSYALFIIAGLPILNTFRIFIYPWVQEGQKLFESLQ